MARRDGNSVDEFGEQLRVLSRGRRHRLTEAAETQRCAGVRNDLAPQLKLVSVPLTALKGAQRSVRKKDGAQIARVRQSIQTLGFCAPILINSDNEILDGHIRAAAAQQAGLSEIACLVVDHLSVEEQRVLRIALNRLGEKGTWDLDGLQSEFYELIALDAPIEIAGFTLPEIDQILLDDGSDPIEQGELEPKGGDVAICQPGDVWALGEHIIACGDARDPALYEVLFRPGEMARLVLTDPPYNVPIAGHVTGGDHREFAMASGEMSAEAFSEFNAQWMTLAADVLDDGGLLAAWIDWRSVAVIIAEGAALGLALLNIVVWTKTNAGMGSLWRSQHELLPIFKKGSAPHLNNVALGKHGRWRSNVWSYPGASSMGSDARQGLKLHPTVKNVAMLEDALLDVTHRGDLVLDVFLGSGSTLIAAEKSGRVCRAIEIDPLYVDVAVGRWIGLTGLEPVLLSRGGGDAVYEPGEDRAAEPDKTNQEATTKPAPRAPEKEGK
jgi:DNA modification methylase